MTSLAPPSVFALLLSWAFNSALAFSDPVISYLSKSKGDFDTIVDVRPLELCKAGTLDGVRCIPVEDLMAPSRRLANISGLLWLLGSAGLSGDEHVLVVGDENNRRDFVAGVLYIAGQRRISVLNARVTGSEVYQIKPGIPRNKIREQVYRTPMRSDRVVLRGELKGMINHERAPILLDGRSESEYWGVRVRGVRGGHLPGAQHLTSVSLQPGRLSPMDFSPQSGDPIVYGHDTFDGLTYLARLVASGIEVRLYLEGWVGWAADGSLPMDSASYPQYGFRGDNRAVEPTEYSNHGISIPAVVATGGGFALAGFWVGRLTKNRVSG